jgi:hypothetical protein
MQIKVYFPEENIYRHVTIVKMREDDENLSYDDILICGKII